MNRKTKNRYKLWLKITTTLTFVAIGLFFTTFITLIWVDIDVAKQWFSSDRMFQYVSIGGLFGSMVLMVVAAILKQYCMAYLNFYKYYFQRVRSARNFKNGLRWMREDRFVQALNVYNTIVDEKARSFYYHILLITTMQGDGEYSEKCRNSYDSMINHYTKLPSHEKED